MTAEQLESLAKRTLDCAFAVHSTFGPGLLESAYKACFVYELRKRGLQVDIEVPVPLVYEGERLADVVSH